MENLFTLSAQHSYTETRPVVDEALKTEMNFARARFSKFENECRIFENRYGMDSELFLNKFESGELGDDVQWFDWYAALRGKKVWEKKYNVLKGISWRM